MRYKKQISIITLVAILVLSTFARPINALLDLRSTFIRLLMSSGQTDWPFIINTSAGTGVFTIDTAGNANATNLNATNLNATRDINGTRLFQGINRTVIPNTCSGTDKLSAINPDGSSTCSTDQTGSGSGAPTTSRYLVGDSDSNLPNAVVATDNIIVMENFRQVEACPVPCSQLHNMYSINGILNNSRSNPFTAGFFGGIMNFSTPMTNQSVASFSFFSNVTTTIGNVNASNLTKLQVKLNITPTNQSGAMKVGMFDTVVNGSINRSNNGVFFNFTIAPTGPPRTTDWYANVCNAGTCTANDTGVNATDNVAWTTLKISNTGPLKDRGKYFEFWINGSLVSNITTNIPLGNSMSQIGVWLQKINNSDGTLRGRYFFLSYAYLELDKIGSN